VPEKMTSHNILNLATWSAGRESIKPHTKQNLKKFKDNIGYDNSDDNYNDDYDYYCYYTIWISLVTGLFFLVLLLDQR
jgi:hypothetical protein